MSLVTVHRPCDHAPLIREQQQSITALEAENRSLRAQLARLEDRLTLYRHIDEDDDRLRALSPAPEEDTP